MNDYFNGFLRVDYLSKSYERLEYVMKRYYSVQESKELTNIDKLRIQELLTHLCNVERGNILEFLDILYDPSEEQLIYLKELHIDDPKGVRERFISALTYYNWFYIFSYRYAPNLRQILDNDAFDENMYDFEHVRNKIDSGEDVFAFPSIILEKLAEEYSWAYYHNFYNVDYSEAFHKAIGSVDNEELIAEVSIR